MEESKLNYILATSVVWPYNSNVFAAEVSDCSVYIV